MINPNYLIGFVGITLVGIWYERWRKSTETKQQQETYNLVREYLINDSSLANSSKPILWVHVPREMNARHWLSFNSRMTNEINKPYLYLTIKSIVDKCGGSFNICLINDDTFGKILPGWLIDLNEVAEPTRHRLRTMALARTLFYYGGLVVPPSLLCFTNLFDAYNKALSGGKDAMVGELLDNNVTSEDFIYAPSSKIMGCVKGSKTMESFDNMLMLLISRDYTDQPTFLGQCSQWWTEQVIAGNAGMIDAEQLGVQTSNGPLTIEMLVGSTYYPVSCKAIALYVPEEEFSRRLNVRWFERQSVEQVLSGDYLLGTYFKAALI